MYAHFFGSRARGYVLIVTSTPALSNEADRTEYPVSSKGDARKLAKSLNATCWNF